MGYREEQFVELAIRRLSKGRWIKLIALEATADFYGWSTVFPSISDAERVDYPDGFRPMPRKRSLLRFKAQPMWIGRSKVNRQGFPVGLTNRFRVTNNVARKDIVAIAQATQIPFSWLTDMAGKRLVALLYTNCNLRLEELSIAKSFLSLR